MRNAKSVALDTVMKHPELSQILKKALVAPQGSTIRAKARKILQSAYAASYNKYKPETFDGQGGVTTGGQNVFDYTANPSSLNSLSIGNTGNQISYNTTGVMVDPGSKIKTNSSTPSISLNASGKVDLPASPATSNYQGIATSLSGKISNPTTSIQPTSPNTTVFGTTAGVKKSSSTISGDTFQNMQIQNSSANKAQVQKDEQTAWNTIKSIYNTQTPMDSSATMQTKQAMFTNIQSDVKAAQKLLQTGTDWGKIWSSLHTKYPDVSAVTLDALLQKGTYYINGQWIPPTPQTPAQTYQNINKSTTQALAPVFVRTLSDTQQTSIKNLLAKVTNNGYVVKPGSADEKNLIYALGLDWKKYSVKGTTVGANTAATISGMPSAEQRLIYSSDGKTYTYLNNDLTTHTGTVGDNYKDPTSIKVAGASSASESAGAAGASGSAGATTLITDGSQPSIASTVHQDGTPWTPEQVRAWADGLYDQGMSAEGIVALASADKEKVAAMLNVPVDSLPNSIELGAQLQEVLDALKQKYNLDGLLDEINARTRNGSNLGNTLEDYMTQRDTYINNINNTIETASAWFNARGIDSPLVAQERDNYMGFLTTLKGGQQKRYADFLKMSVDMYTQDTQALKDDYNAKLQNFSDELKTKQIDTEQQYNDMKTALLGFANAQDNLYAREQTVYDLKSKGLPVYGDIANSVVAASPAGGAAGSNMMNDTSWLANKAQDSFSNVPLTYTDESTGKMKNDAVMYNMPIKEAMETFAANNTTSDKTGTGAAVIPWLRGIIASATQTPIDDGNISKVTANYQNLIHQYYVQAGEVADTPEKQQAVIDNATTLATALKSRVSVGVYNMVNSGTTLADTQAAIDDLCYTHNWFGKDDKQRTNADITPEFLAKWNTDHSKVPQFIRDGLLTQFKYYTATNDAATGKSVNLSPADVFLMDTSGKDPNKVPYYKSTDLTSSNISYIVSTGVLAQLAQDVLLNKIQDV